MRRVVRAILGALRFALWRGVPMLLGGWVALIVSTPGAIRLPVLARAAIFSISVTLIVTSLPAWDRAQGKE